MFKKEVVLLVEVRGVYRLCRVLIDRGINVSRLVNTRRSRDLRSSFLIY